MRLMRMVAKFRPSSACLARAQFASKSGLVTRFGRYLDIYDSLKPVEVLQTLHGELNHAEKEMGLVFRFKYKLPIQE